MGIGLQAVAGGIRQGLRDYRENMRSVEDEERRKKQDERQKVMDDRDATRFEAEKGRMDEEKRQRDARAAFQKQLEQINADAMAGTNGFDQFGFAGQPQQPQGAIAAPGAPAQPAASNPFKATADGLYRNQRGADQLIADRRAAALESLYAALGQPEKAATARSQMMELFDKDVERKTKTALAAAALGAPGSLDALSRVYSYFNDGISINPQSGQWDAKTKSWKGIEFVDDKGNATKRDITQQDLLALAKRDAAALAMFNIEQEWKGKDYELKERQTKADEKRADASVISANASASRATALNQRERDEANGTQQKAMVEAVARMFPQALKEYKPEELMLEKDKGQAKLAAQQREKRMYDKTLDLAGLNPRIDVRTLAGIARQGKVNAQEDEDGRIFTTVGSTKVYLR